MKKTLLLLLVLTTFIIPAFADSPVTSTDFYRVYLDLPEVSACTNTGILTDSLARILGDKDYPLDNKMAMINALSWDFNGKDNTTKYIDYIADYRDLYDNLFESEWLPHDYVVIGYLLLMDDYFHPEQALPWLEKGAELMPQSFTAHMILAIAYAQRNMDKDWKLVWKVCSDVLDNDQLDLDMREPAVDVIVDYLILYK